MLTTGPQNRVKETLGFGTAEVPIASSCLVVDDYSAQGA
jgi:hypothetical protein